MYQSPEQLILHPHRETTPLTEKVDIFAAGLVLFELCYIFKTQHERTDAIKNLREKRILPMTGLSEAQRTLIIAMTDPDPKMRPSADEIIKSPEVQNWKKEFEDKQ